ncbi:MAG: uroporphyrinogen-III C-methyltransferase [Ilumatobacter sp.]
MSSQPSEPVSPTSARPYLLAWKLDGKRVVVVGGGNIGTAKVETLLGTGADIVVVDPTPSTRVRELAADGRVTLRQRRARPTDVLRAVLLVAATGDSSVNRRLRRWARPVGAVVNAVDDQANCDVTVPAVVNRGPATVAITTGGATPAGARFLREELTAVVEATIPAAMGDVLEGAHDSRLALRRRHSYRYDYAAWRQWYFEPALASIRQHRRPSISDLRHSFEAEFEAQVTPLRQGKVVLVGAGPGGADLITVRGAAALRRADVVVYDRLADPGLIDLAPIAAERIGVGKGKGFGPSQDEISDLLVARALAGDNVVRLKGGDSFVFGRGREEIDAVERAGISVEVVPGVTSALGAPGLAGISVTDRRVASSFTVLTGHRSDADDDDWRSFATSTSTLVVLMAATTADNVAQRLIELGRDSCDPVAFVHAAGTPDQQVGRSSLEATAASGCPFASPTVMVIGAVAASASSDVVEALRERIPA